jgi:hypothetical protein
VRVIPLPLVALAAVLASCGGSHAPAQTTGSARSAPTRTSTAPTRTSTAPTPAPAAQFHSREVAPGVVRVAFRGISATLRASGHHPRANGRWPVSFAVSRSGRPVEARVRYEYLFAGQVVARRSNYSFTGSFHDTFVWPSSALGYPLRFRAVITAANVTLNLDYPVQVVR